MGHISPNWDLLHKHLIATGPGYYTVAQREDWLFDNRSSRPGDDLKDDVCPTTAIEAWQFWNAQKHGFTQLQQPGPVVVFPADTAVLDPLFQQICREEELPSLQYRNRGSKGTRARGTKRTGCRGIWVATVAKLCYIFLDPMFAHHHDRVGRGAL